MGCSSEAARASRDKCKYSFPKSSWPAKSSFGTPCQHKWWKAQFKAMRSGQITWKWSYPYRGRTQAPCALRWAPCEKVQTWHPSFPVAPLCPCLNITQFLLSQVALLQYKTRVYRIESGCVLHIDPGKQLLCQKQFYDVPEGRTAWEESGLYL